MPALALSFSRHNCTIFTGTPALQNECLKIHLHRLDRAQTIMHTRPTESPCPSPPSPSPIHFDLVSYPPPTPSPVTTVSFNQRHVYVHNLSHFYIILFQLVYRYFFLLSRFTVSLPVQVWRYIFSLCWVCVVNLRRLRVTVFIKNMLRRFFSL